jgi:hypothetical protein
MQWQLTSTVFNASAALQKSKLLPAQWQLHSNPIVCCNCSFVNHHEFNFCTNCGYPVHPDPENLAVYQFHLNKRLKLKLTCLVKIEHARNALYVLAAFSMIGLFYVFSSIQQWATTGSVMVILGVIYAGLGRWSLQKPFTALLISLVIMLTLTAINTWAELSNEFTTAGGVYLLVVQLIIIYFLLQGVKGAFHADILEEEFKL